MNTLEKLKAAERAAFAALHNAATNRRMAEDEEDAADQAHRKALLAYEIARDEAEDIAAERKLKTSFANDQALRPAEETTKQP